MNKQPIELATKAIELAFRGESFESDYLERILEDDFPQESHQAVLEYLRSESWIRREDDRWYPGLRVLLLTHCDLSTPDINGCIESIEAVQKYIKRHDGATKEEILTDLAPEENFLVGVTGMQMVGKLGEVTDYRNWWWREIVKPGLRALPEIKAPLQDEGEWEIIQS